jgi:MFS family permease
MAMFLAFQSLTFQLELPPPAGLGYDILSTGLFILPFALVVVIIALPVGIAVSKIGVRPFVLVGALVAALGFAFASVTSDAAGLSTYLMVIAAGMGMQMVAIQNLLVLSVSPREMGLATSLNTVFRNVGTSLGAPIAGSLISTYTAWYYAGSYKGIPILYSIPSKVAFQYAYDVAVIAFIAGFFVTFLSREVIGRWAEKGAAVELNDDHANELKPSAEPART